MTTTYADWKAPKRDGELLIWPAPASLREVVEANHRLLDLDRRGGLPLAELRREARGFFGYAEDDRVLVAGHQTELWHPGVWAKNALIDALARAVPGGRALHLAVDTDAPKHLSVRWPHFAQPISDDARLTAADWSGLLEPPTPAHLASIESALRQAQPAFGYTPVMEDWLGYARQAALEGISGSDLSKWLATAGQQLDWSLGLDYAIATLSPVLNSRPWLAFAWHVLCHIEAFTDSYNAALAAYRLEQGIKSDTRPMPNLFADAQHIEAPFWIDELGRDTPRRHRAMIERRDGKHVLHEPYSDEALELDPSLDPEQGVERLVAFLSRNRLRVGPRALTLTMFVRLFVADLFVHGIGGGRYDKVTDRIIRDHFGAEPPAFAVSTATLYLPQAIARERACVPCVIHDGHRLSHRLTDQRKQELVAAIDAAPRGSRERGELFQEMHRDLRIARETDPRMAAWQAQLDAMKRRAAEDEVVFDREVFYAIQPRDRLVEMIDRYRQAMAAT